MVKAMTHSLYHLETALPVNELGKSPMQPVCKKRLQAGGARLIEGVSADDLDAVSRSLAEIEPLLACQFRNAMLPCAHACEYAANDVIVEFQYLAKRNRN